MSETRDCREEIVNSLAMWAEAHGIDVSDAKIDFYMILNNVEITSRSTEVAELQGNRNEYLLKRFLVAKKVSGRTPRTIEMYAKSITSVLGEIGKTVEDITADDIRYYMALRLRRDGVSKVTVGNEIRPMSSFFGWLQAEEILQKNIMLKVERIKKQKTQKKALTETEVEKLRLYARGEREKLIIEMLLSTGCRVSELANILITDIDGEQVLIHGKGEKDRYVYLNAKAMLTLESYMAKRTDRNPYLLPRMKGIGEIRHEKRPRREYQDLWEEAENVCEEGHINMGTIESVTRRIAKRAGVERANPHKFRRTCATMALRRGMPIEQVSKMLGHESVETTQIYLDLSEDDLKQAHKKYVV